MNPLPVAVHAVDIHVCDVALSVDGANADIELRRAAIVPVQHETAVVFLAGGVVHDEGGFVAAKEHGYGESGLFADTDAQ